MAKKNDNSSLLLTLAITAGAWLLKRNLGVAGIGATKRAPRRIWVEIEQAQKQGIDLNDPDGWSKHLNEIDYIMAHNHVIPAKSSSDKPMEQRYFNQLRRAYKSIAGTSLPYKESVVRNENGDVILMYRDYELDKISEKAADYVYNLAMENMQNDPETSACWATIAMIASGKLKFVWKGDKIHRGIEQSAFGGNHPEERKKRISYLASPAKGGQYIDEVAHNLWQRTGMNADDQSITDGVIDAVLQINSVGEAKAFCEREYINAHQTDNNGLIYQDMPF